MRQLATQSGVSYHTVFRAVSEGRVPRGANLVKLAKAFDLTVSDLYKSPEVVRVERAAIEAAKYAPAAASAIAAEIRDSLREDIAAAVRPQLAANESELLRLFRGSLPADQAEILALSQRSFRRNRSRSRAGGGSL